MRTTLLTTSGQPIAPWPGIATEGSGKDYIYKKKSSNNIKKHWSVTKSISTRNTSSSQFEESRDKGIPHRLILVKSGRDTSSEYEP
jgi:hypothetical protein